MVQVDVVWSYAFGASFAAAAAHQLKDEEKPFTTRSFVFNLLFLSLLFAPSGIYLLWEHTQWETMQVATSKEDIPAWLVTIFAVTNITQGILGYWVSYVLARAKKLYEAHVNWIVEWIVFWFILVCGWDCTGYQRFLYDMSVNNGQLWQPEIHMGVSFFYASRVWWTLVAMGIVFAPMLMYGYIQYFREGLKGIRASNIAGPIQILSIVFGTQWVLCLGLAVIASLLVMFFSNLFGGLIAGYIVGIASFAVVAYLLLKKNSLFHRLIRSLIE
jgi:hypothetical protein